MTWSTSTLTKSAAKTAALNVPKPTLLPVLDTKSISDMMQKLIDALDRNTGAQNAGTQQKSGTAAAAAFNKKTGGSWSVSDMFGSRNSELDQWSKPNTNPYSLPSQYGNGMGYKEGTSWSVDHNFVRYAYTMKKDKDGNVYAALTGTTKIAKKALGGLLMGPGTATSDSIRGMLNYKNGGMPINLSNGEYIQRAAAVQKYGVNFMDAVNSGKYNPEAGSISNNTFNVTINAGANANADDIAKAVIRTINQQQGVLAAKNNKVNTVRH